MNVAAELICEQFLLVKMAHSGENVYIFVITSLR
jgi:hypothetical protein